MGESKPVSWFTARFRSYLAAPRSPESTAIAADVDAIRSDVEALRADVHRVLEALQLVYEDDPGNRRRLYAAREDADYEAAFDEQSPLVSVLIPTYTAHDLLRTRAIPSVLAQTYENWELVIVGDSAPPETATVIEAFGDPRIRYSNRPLRGPYPDDAHDAWLVTAVPPVNEAARLARGRWLAPFADDDALRPNALGRLVEDAQERRLEFVYSQLNYVGADGVSSEPFGQYPPRLHLMGTQGAILHSGLRFFEHELGDAVFRMPSDWGWVRRMMRAGVRIGFIEEVLCDYYPSRRGA